MKYIDDFRDGELARALGAAIGREVQPGRSYRLMEFCGGHTHAISRYGIADLLPANVSLIHGPGCPVCVLPIGRIDQAIKLALEQGVILCSYGDTLRVPASRRLSLLKAKSQGADVRMIYSTSDALQIARDNPGREVVFLAIGFETTTPPTAVAVEQARVEGLTNFSILCNHVLTPAAMHAILAVEGGVKLDGFIGPAHVSTVIGSAPYEPFPRDYDKPVVIAGFEPLDVMRAIQLLIRQINEGRAEVENEFTRAVTRDGNRKAQALVAKVFELRESFEWRGLGTVPHSALRLRAGYTAFDAEQKFDAPYVVVPDNKACECAAILRGEKRPEQCKIFGKACTPDTPLGSCMVSSEGACAAHYSYGRFRQVALMAFWAYLLRCGDGSYYCGHTDALEQRLGQHQTGACGGYTASRLPVELVWSQAFVTREEALVAERQIKGWGRKKKEALVRGDWSEIQRLAWGTRNPLPEHLKK